MHKINGQDMKRHNVHLIINTIMQHGPISRTELRDRVGLTAATVINITNDLLERNIILQEGLAAGSSKGRKALVLNVNPTAFYTLGASITTRRIGVGLADFRGEIVDHADVTIRNTITPEEAIEIIAEKTQLLTQRHHVPTEKLVGMGVAAPGPLDAHTGHITVPPDLPNWRNVPLEKLLEKRLRMPVRVANESNAAALAEYAAGDEKEFVFFIGLFRLGVGGGLVLGGENLLGFHGSAGEVGHLLVEPGGRQCGCGSRGCLEAMISEDALLEAAALGGAGKLTLEELFERSRNLDPVCYAVVKQAADYLTMAICDVVHMVSPSRIVLGGPLAQMSPQLADLAFQQVHSRSYPHDYSNIQLQLSTFGEQVFLRGAVSIANAELMQQRLERIGS